MYKLNFLKKYSKFIASIPKEYHSSIDNKLKEISLNPHEAGKKLQNMENKYSARVGIYRIIYSIKNDVLEILIYKIGHRKNVYD